MSPSRPTSLPIAKSIARHPTAKKIVRAWRELTGHTTRGTLGPDASTLLACSGGADSSALVLALSALGPRVVVAHVVHDMRPPDQALADRDAVAALAQQLGLRMVEAHVSLRSARGNAEAVARRLRYDALARLAREANCPFVATAHHADDQLETLLMRLLRGSGPGGLAGVAPRRRLAPGLTLIRPMLALSRDDAESLCAAAAWTWRTDATNADLSRLRAQIRHRVTPALREIRPDVALRAARAAGLLRQAAGIIDDRVAELARMTNTTSTTNTTSATTTSLGALTPHQPHDTSESSKTTDQDIPVLAWPRDLLKNEPAIVVGALLQWAASQLTAGRRIDKISQPTIDRAVRAVADGAGGSREFRLGPALVLITRARVTVQKAETHG